MEGCWVVRLGICETSANVRSVVVAMGAHAGVYHEPTLQCMINSEFSENMNVSALRSSVIVALLH